MARTTLEIFNDHLARADRGDVEGDIAANFALDCVLLTTYGRFTGHDGVRAAAALLAEQIPNAIYEYTQRSVESEMAFLEWTAAGNGAMVRDGADSYLCRDGRIQIMTIHYTVEPARPQKPPRKENRILGVPRGSFYRRYFPGHCGPLRPGDSRRYSYRPPPTREDHECGVAHYRTLRRSAGGMVLLSSRRGIKDAM